MSEDEQSWFKRNIPYPSDKGWEKVKEHHIPQPTIQITANHDGVRSKLDLASQLAEESRWIVTLISSILILYLRIVGNYQLVSIQTLLTIMALTLIVLSSFRFRIVRDSEPVEMGIEASDAAVIRKPVNCSEDVEADPSSCTTHSEEHDDV